MGVLKILITIFLIITLLITGIIVYLYYFYSFKTIHLCITNNTQDSQIKCKTNEECIPLIKDKIINTIEMPDFMTERIEEAINKAVFCEETCKVKEIYDSMSKGVANCKQEEYNIPIRIRGKEGIELLKSGVA